VSLLLDARVAGAPADDPRAGLRVLLVDPCAQDALNVGDGAGLTDRFGIQVGGGELGLEHDDMGVGVDEARHQALAAQIDHLGVGILGGHDGRPIADGEDLAVLDSQGVRPVPNSLVAVTVVTPRMRASSSAGFAIAIYASETPRCRLAVDREKRQRGYRTMGYRIAELSA
jgi:hypothetical protein